MNKIKIIFTDLDGTILPHNKSISGEDLETFKILQEKNIVKVIATGRTLNALKKAIPLDFPIDYGIFSSGSGIINWQTQEIIKSYSLKSNIIDNITSNLIDLELSFFIFDLIPHNHYFQYYKSKYFLSDFKRYISKYPEFSRPFNKEKNNQDATQMLTMLEDVTQFNELNNLLNKLDLKIVRATSPIDQKTIWMEFLNKNVSKGNAANFICEKLGIDSSYSLGIGNDFNDIDLLNFTNYSYVVDNAPWELKKQYNTTASVYNNGFSQVVRKFI